MNIYCVFRTSQVYLDLLRSIWIYSGPTVDTQTLSRIRSTRRSRRSVDIQYSLPHDSRVISHQFVQESGIRNNIDLHSHRDYSRFILPLLVQQLQPNTQQLEADYTESQNHNLLKLSVVFTRQFRKSIPTTHQQLTTIIPQAGDSTRRFLHIRTTKILLTAYSNLLGR